MYNSKQIRENGELASAHWTLLDLFPIDAAGDMKTLRQFWKQNKFNLKN